MIESSHNFEEKNMNLIEKKPVKRGRGRKKKVETTEEESEG